MLMRELQVTYSRYHAHAYMKKIILFFAVSNENVLMLIESKFMIKVYKLFCLLFDHFSIPVKNL